MSLKTKCTVFPQQKVTRNRSDDFSVLRETLNNNDVGIFFMLADATCSTRPKADIEKIHIDVFKSMKIATPKISKNDLETLEILNDSELMHEIKMSQKEIKKGGSVRWKKARIPT